MKNRLIILSGVPQSFEKARREQFNAIAVITAGKKPMRFIIIIFEAPNTKKMLTDCFTSCFDKFSLNSSYLFRNIPIQYIIAPTERV